MRDSAVVEAEIRHLERQIERLDRRELDPELFKKLRLQYGIYSMRRSATLRQAQDPSTKDPERSRATGYMVRVKVRLGIITPAQLEALAAICEEFTPSRSGHLTTRQDVQLYGIERPKLSTLLRKFAAVGLTTLDASGNVVRNVTCCPYAGVSPEEPFDITPYAQAVSDYLLRNPLTQILPRKVKIAFEGCATDHARTPNQDNGVVAALQGDQPGFRIYAGGGLGPAPRVAQLLEPWTGWEWLLPSLEAILRVFDRFGERRSRARARLKFLVEQLGWEEFRKRVLEERQIAWATQSGYSLAITPQPRDDPPPTDHVSTPTAPSKRHATFERWASTNVMPQKQQTLHSVLVRVPLGDVTALQLRGLAAIARRYAGGARFTNEQNILLRSVREDTLGLVRAELERLGLAEAGAGRLVDITRCPGADSCLSAVTHPRGLAETLEQMFHNGLSPWADAKLSIKISGCTNSCGHHHLADLGFFGMSVKVGARHLPCYQMLVGGCTAEGQATFGKRLLRVPARQTPEAVKRLMKLYQEQQQPDEAFTAFVDRVGLEPLERALADLADLTEAASQPELFIDVGETEPFILEAGKGECAE